jgi:glycosyltransferase involved in cell wall biosynthesis
VSVILFTRKPRPGENFSIELIVDELLTGLEPEFEARRFVSRFYSSGLLPRLYNVIEAALHQGDVNHVTGDVHILTYLLRRGRTLLTIHDCARIRDGTLRARLLKLLWFTIPVRRCAAISVVSETVKQELVRLVGVPPEKVHVIPSLVPRLYRPQAKPFDAERPRLLQVGTAANKNLPRLCEALRGIRCELTIVGNLSTSQLAALSANQIVYTQHSGISTEQLYELYCASDVVTFVSTFEGFGMPIIEGNRVGRPVLTSNVASMPEVAGDAACLVDPLDPLSMRAGIRRIIDDADYRAGLVQRGFLNAARFEAEPIVAAYAQLYRQLARGDL